MRRLTPLEEAIYNAGERLIPGVTMGVAEVVRHRSSYLFFKRVIEEDRAVVPATRRPLEIVDLGCGVGHGCCTLAGLPNVRVVGVDTSPESLEYARRHYDRENVEYELGDLTEYIPRMPKYDYVVSRGSLEHVPTGLELARSIEARFRVMFDVPYAEAPGVNPHHRIHDVREETFRSFRNAELFYQDLWGAMYDARTKPSRPNMIVCISSRPGLPAVAESLEFPIPAWEPEGIKAKLSLLVERGMVSGGRVKRRVKRLL